MNAEPAEETPPSLTEWQMIEAVGMRERVLYELGFSAEDLPDEGSPIRFAVKQLRALPEQEGTRERLQAAKEFERAYLAYGREPLE